MIFLSLIKRTKLRDDFGRVIIRWFLFFSPKVLKIYHKISRIFKDLTKVSLVLNLAGDS